MSVITRSGLDCQYSSLCTLLTNWKSATSLLEFYSLYPRLSFLLSEIETQVRQQNVRFGPHFIASLLIHVFLFLNPRTSSFGLQSVCKHWWSVLNSTTFRKIVLDPYRLVQLGHCYRHGRRGVQNYKEALHLYQLAASQSEDCDPEAEAWVAYSYLRPLGGVEENPEEAFRLAFRGVQKGHPQAFANMGMCYAYGYGVQENLAEAIRFYRRGVDLGNSCAQIKLGISYLDGIGVEENNEEAARLLNLAAMQKNPIGQTQLGYCYENGFGVPQDIPTAVHWYRLAVEQNNPEGQYNLARLYHKGEGVMYDLNEALRLCTLAAAQGYAEAQKLYKKLIRERDKAAGKEAEDSDLESDAEEEEPN